jgi:hypothetical protein
MMSASSRIHRPNSANRRQLKKKARDEDKQKNKIKGITKWNTQKCHQQAKKEILLDAMTIELEH